MNTLTTPASTTPAAGTGHGTPNGTAASRPAPALLPPVDVIEDSTGITLLADLPGVPKDALKLGVDGDQLSVEGTIVLPVPPGTDARHAEVQRSTWRRTFTLSKELDANAVSAELQHGVLKVRIPKAPHAQPRRVTVQVG